MYFNNDCKSLEQINVILKSGVFDVSLCDGMDVPYNTNAPAYLSMLLLLKLMKNDLLVTVVKDTVPRKADILGGKSPYFCVIVDV